MGSKISLTRNEWLTSMVPPVIDNVFILHIVVKELLQFSSCMQKCNFFFYRPGRFSGSNKLQYVFKTKHTKHDTAFQAETVEAEAKKEIALSVI